MVPPQHGGIKVNVDGASGGIPLHAACGSIFVNHSSEHLGSFACNLDTVNVFSAEIMGAILTMEYAAAQN